jgi:tuftelin-interacting protein 11
MSDSDSDDSAALSSDDEVERLDRRLPRYKYSTFDDNNDGNDNNDSRRRHRTKEDAIYGIFMEQDSDDNDTNGSRTKRPRHDGRGGGSNPTGSSTSTHPRTTSASGKRAAVPIFVKGTAPDTRKSAENDNDPAVVAAAAAAGVDSKPSEPKEQPTKQELDFRRQQEEANQHFLSLLNKGQGKKKRPRLSETVQQESMTATTTTTSTASATSTGGIGSHRAATVPEEYYDDAPVPHAGLGMPATFFGTAAALTQPLPPRQFQQDPSLGKWEKHTKGIGMKLLSKMGYKGSGGLGAKLKLQSASAATQAGKKGRVGISRPVEVVVRPTKLGLGFGNFKEATKLKANQEIEADLSGKEMPVAKKMESRKSLSSFSSKSEASALPSVQDLMKQQSWKKGAKHVTKGRQRRKVIPYTELLEKQKPFVIIDMRGPNPEDASKEQGEREVPLAEELLHNASLLLNTYENKIHSASHFAKSTSQKLASLESDVASMQERQQEAKERTLKLERVMEILNEIEVSTAANTVAISNVTKVQGMVKELRSIFTAEERATLKFSRVVVPLLLGNVVQASIDQWDPLNDDLQVSEGIVQSVLSVSSFEDAADTQEELKSIRKSMFTKHLLPRIKLALESSRWDPIHCTESALQLYELVREIAIKSSSVALHTATLDDDNAILMSSTIDDSESLADLVKEEIVNNTVYPKLQRSLNQWKPRLNEDGLLADRIDLWILPWIPYIEHRALLPALVSDCKRKVRSAVSFLQKSVSKDDTLFEACIASLRPWRGVFKKESIYNMISSSVTSRLSRSLSRMPVARKLESQDWKAVDILLQLGNLGLITDHEFLSVMEGELLPNWELSLHEWMEETPGDYALAAEVYVEWKLRLLQSSSTEKASTKDSSSQHLLQGDPVICGSFYGVVLMLHAASESNVDALDELHPSTTNFRVVLARRTAEEKKRASDDLIRMETGVVGGTADNGREARVRLHRNGQTPTFREVVEEFARERGILFQPRLGNNSTKDGKQIFLFGVLPVYFESNVVFSQQGSVWSPISLDALATMAAAANPSS